MGYTDILGTRGILGIGHEERGSQSTWQCILEKKIPEAQGSVDDAAPFQCPGLWHRASVSSLGTLDSLDPINPELEDILLSCRIQGLEMRV